MQTIKSKENRNTGHDGCCTNDEKNVVSSPAAFNSKSQAEDSDHTHGAKKQKPAWQERWPLLLSLLILIVYLVLEYSFAYEPAFSIVLAINVTYLLAGWNVLCMAFRKLKRGDVFNEFVLMSVATLGAFYIGELTEGVAVMIFYSIGEWFQDSAVNRAQANIKALLDIRPDQVTAIRNGKTEVVIPSAVSIGETIQVRAGKRWHLMVN